MLKKFLAITKPRTGKSKQGNGANDSAANQPLPPIPGAPLNSGVRGRSNQVQKLPVPGRPQPMEEPAVRKCRDDNHVYKMFYYHSNLSNLEEVKSIMFRWKFQNGHFLLRSNLSGSGMFIVTVTHNQNFVEFKIETSDYAYFLSAEKEFETIDDLVRYYSTHDLPHGTPGVRLLFPIKKVVDCTPVIFVGDNDEGNYLFTGTVINRHLLNRQSVDVGSGINIQPQSGQLSAYCLEKDIEPAAFDLSRNSQPGANLVSVISGPGLSSQAVATSSNKPSKHQTCTARSRSCSNLISGTIQTVKTYEVKQHELFSLEIPAVAEYSDVTDFNRKTGSIFQKDNDIRSNREKNMDVIESAENVVVLENNEEATSTTKTHDVIKNVAIYSDVVKCENLNDEMELPQGWRLKVEVDRFRKELKFVSPHGDTHSDLPTKITLSLSLKQQAWIRGFYEGNELQQVQTLNEQ